VQLQKSSTESFCGNWPDLEKMRGDWVESAHSKILGEVIREAHTLAQSWNPIVAETQARAPGVSVKNEIF
jgi:hypothetical protein